MRKKRVLQISTSPLQYDGLSKVILSLIDHTSRENCQIDILLANGGIKEEKEELDKRNIKYYQGPFREKNTLKYFIYLIKLLKKRKYDVVHVHGNSATMAIEAIAMKICKVPLRITHSHNTVTAHPLMHALLKPILNFCVNAPVACGHDAGAYIYSKEFKVIPNCINVSEFKFDIDKREGYRKKLNVKDEFLIGNVGRFTFQKNHEFMIEGFAKIKKKIPDALLLLIGSGELVEDIKLKAEKLGLKNNIIFLGNSDEVNCYLSAMDVYILPSRYEGLSVSAIEAQASGLECIMSDKISTETKKTDKCVFLSIDNSDNWAESIIEIYKKNKTKTIDQLLSDRLKSAEDVIKAGYDYSNLNGVIEDIWGLNKSVM